MINMANSAKSKDTILESWPGLKEDLITFLSDTDSWIVTELRKGIKAKDWSRITKVVEIMESMHNLSHSH